MTTDQHAASVLCNAAKRSFNDNVANNPYVLANPALGEICHEAMSAIEDAYKAIGEKT